VAASAVATFLKRLAVYEAGHAVAAITNMQANLQMNPIEYVSIFLGDQRVKFKYPRSYHLDQPAQIRAHIPDLLAGIAADAVLCRVSVALAVCRSGVADWEEAKLVYEDLSQADEQLVETLDDLLVGAMAFIRAERIAVSKLADALMVSGRLKGDEAGLLVRSYLVGHSASASELDRR